MKILLRYLKPYKWLVALTLLLASINIGFSLLYPIIFGKLINLANAYQVAPAPDKHYDWHDYPFLKMDFINKNGKPDYLYGAVWLLLGFYNSGNDQPYC